MATKDSSAPLEQSEGGGATQNKYDRQLRMWQAHGQLRLLNARVCALGSGPVASEALKNLVLPGTGRKGKDNEGNAIDGCVVVVDDAKIQKRDFGNNFFLENGKIGESRAKVVSANLQELNPDDTKVTYESRNIDKLIQEAANKNGDGKDFFDAFTLVIGTQLTEERSVELERICRERGIPLILAKVNGLIGYVRNSVECHDVVEPHLSTKPYMYYNADNPWPELLKLAYDAHKRCGEATTQGEKKKRHKGVPWLLLLVRKIDEMKKAGKMIDKNTVRGALKEENEKYITDYNEKFYAQGLKEANGDQKKIGELDKNLEDIPSENYAEAGTDVSYGTKTAGDVLEKAKEGLSRYGSNFKIVWEDARVTQKTAPELPNTHSGHFWMMARTLRRFYETHKRFPVRKGLPDMESENSIYLQLERCFAEKAAEDEKLFKRMLCEEYPPEKGIPSDSAIRRFCKSGVRIEAYKMGRLEDEMKRDFGDYEHVDVDDLEADWEEEKKDFDLHPFKFYLLLRVAESFRREHGYYPGWTDDTYKHDRGAVRAHMQKVLTTSNLDDDFLNDKHAMEIVRYGAGEIHAVAAFIGGVVAQEATKLITHQFQPLENTFLYNALDGSSLTFNL